MSDAQQIVDTLTEAMADVERGMRKLAVLLDNELPIQPGLNKVSDLLMASWENMHRLRKAQRNALEAAR